MTAVNSFHRSEMLLKHGTVCIIKVWECCGVQRYSLTLMALQTLREKHFVRISGHVFIRLHPVEELIMPNEKSGWLKLMSVPLPMC